MQIFISYRRADSGEIVGRIYDHLERDLGEKSIFIDVDSIAPGIDFRRSLDRSLKKCDVVLCIIGPNWSGSNPDGTSRIEVEGDYVHLEIGRALELKKRIIPVLVRNAEPLSPSKLPVGIRDLAYLHAIRVRPDPDFRKDLRHLVSMLSVEHEESSVVDEDSAAPDTHALATPVVLEPNAGDETIRNAVSSAERVADTGATSHFESMKKQTRRLCYVLAALGIGLTVLSAWSFVTGIIAPSGYKQTYITAAVIALSISLVVWFVAASLWRAGVNRRGEGR
jgi:hypothetical protein